MALFVISTLVITPLGLTQSANAQPPNIIYQAPITIYNNQSVATPDPFQQLLQLNESTYNGYITYNGTVANFEFSYSNNTIIPAWIEGNNSGILNIFINIISIPANSQLTIYIDFASLTTNLLSNSGATGIGEAPQLSPTDGQYDDGARVFEYYQNFGGLSAMPSGWSANYPTFNPTNIEFNSQATGNGFSMGLNSLPSSLSSTTTVWDFYGSIYGTVESQTASTDSSPGYTSYGFIEGKNSNSVIYFSNANTAFYGNTGYTDTNNNKVYTMQLNSATSVEMFINYTLIYSTTSAASAPISDFYFTAYQSTTYYFWFDTRSLPPNGVMPSVSYGAVILYTVTFNESGLPSNTLWNITIDNSIYSTNITSINVTIPNGIYPYEAQSSNGLYSPIYGNVTVNGANLTVNLTFISYTYNVEFTESGLSSGTLWNMTLSNSTYNANYYNSTNTTSLNFSIPNSTYSYTALANNFYNPVYGNVTVNGANISDSILFTLAPTYNVQFIESGLPSGTLWNTAVNTIMGNFTNSTNTRSMNFSLPNGTYNYSEYTSISYYSNVLGNFTVNGANTTVYLDFYNVTFLESGLPSGTEWNIYLNSSTESLIEQSTNTTEMSYYLDNGNYTYLMSQNNQIVFLFDYVYNGIGVIQNGNFTVNNSNITIYLNFTLYTVSYNINESYNYPYLLSISNSTYGVGYNLNSSFMLYMPNGTYNDAIIATNSSFPFAITSGFVNPFSVNGADLTFNITFSTYNVEFNVTGLPSGDILSIAVYDTDNGSFMWGENSTTNMYALLPNGNYTYFIQVSDNNYTAFGNPTSFTIDNNLIIVNLSIQYDVLIAQESGLPTNVNYYFNLTYANGTLITNVSLSPASQTEYIWQGLPIDLNLTLNVGVVGYSPSFNYTFYFTGNSSYDFVFSESISNGNITLNVAEIGLPINTLWYFDISLANNSSISYNITSYYSFIILSNLSANYYSITAYSQGYNVISYLNYEITNNTSLTINFILNTVTMGNNTTFTNPYNSTNNFNLTLSQWETIGFLGGSSIIMAIVGAFINPIGAFIVLGIEMLIGYELSIVDAWILFFIGLAITALIFYRRDVTDKGEE